MNLGRSNVKGKLPTEGLIGAAPTAKVPPVRVDKRSGLVRFGASSLGAVADGYREPVAPGHSEPFGAIFLSRSALRIKDPTALVRLEFLDTED